MGPVSAVPLRSSLPELTLCLSKFMADATLPISLCTSSDVLPEEVEALAVFAGLLLSSDVSALMELLSGSSTRAAPSSFECQLGLGGTVSFSLESKTDPHSAFSTSLISALFFSTFWVIRMCVALTALGLIFFFRWYAKARMPNAKTATPATIPITIPRDGPSPSSTV